MDEILLSKGDRLEKPRTVSVPLRRDVYNWLSKIAASECRPVSWVIRALAEDAFDNRSDQEVSGNE